jgi:hypothetical protein
MERTTMMMTTDLGTRLEAAALFLAGPGSIKERLCDAYRTHLEDIPEADRAVLGSEFADMIQALHREQALPGDNVVCASVRKLSNQQVHQYAGLVVRLYGLFAGVGQAGVAPEFSRTRAARVPAAAASTYLVAGNGANH